MTPLKWLVVLSLTVFMIAAAVGMGRWAESLNPQGISTATSSPADPASTSLTNTAVTLQNTTRPRDAFAFGASLGLLAAALLYGAFAIALLIRAKAAGRRPSQLTYWIASLAGTGLALSYVVDDYFY